MQCLEVFVRSFASLQEECSDRICHILGGGFIAACGGFRWFSTTVPVSQDEAQLSQSP